MNQQQPNASFSEAKKQANGCKPHQVTTMELASPIWNLDMHCIFDTVESHPTFPLTAMVVVLNSPQLTSPEERWSLQQPVLPLDELKTYLKIEQEVSNRK